MASGNQNTQEHVAPFAVLGVPSRDAKHRMEKLNRALRSEFGGPELHPHLTVVGITSLTKKDALKRFKAACQGLKAYPAHAKGVSTGSSYWQCVYVLLDATPQVVETSVHCSKHFGYVSDAPYMPHISLLYGNLTDEEKKKASKKANALDEGIGDLSFTIDHLELWITGSDVKSWVKVEEFKLETC